MSHLKPVNSEISFLSRYTLPFRYTQGILGMYALSFIFLDLLNTKIKKKC